MYDFFPKNLVKFISLYTQHKSPCVSARFLIKTTLLSKLICGGEIVFLVVATTLLLLKYK
jgi:hypothetical protein